MKLGTHNGSFHADDVCAYVILSELYESTDLIRSRDEAVLNDLDLVFDVGGGKFDHHSKEKVYRNSGIPYAAAGLVWRHYGKELLSKKAPELEQDAVDYIHRSLDESFFAGLDAVDNGMTLSASFSMPNLADAVHWFNPVWDSTDDVDSAFQQASTLVRQVFNRALAHQLASYRARASVRSAFETREEPHLLILAEGCPWLDTLLEIDTRREVLFVVYPDRTRGYRLQTVRLRKDTFENRQTLPAHWAGLTDQALNRVTGVTDAIFCHPARFLAGADSLASILKMAHLALAARD